MRATRIPPCLLLCAVLLVSCASVEHYKEIDDSVSRGDFPEALEKVKKEENEGYREKDAILFYLDAGLLSHYSQSWAESSAYLGKGEKAIEVAFTKSLSQGAASYLVNDMTKEYDGEDYEDIYLNVFNSLNYYHRGSLDGALVEVRRIDNKLKNLSVKYGQSITNAQRDLLDKDSGIPFDASVASIRFSNSALARYLSMLFYRADGLFDDARIDRDKVKLAFANQRDMYPFPLPSTLDGELSIPRGMARLNVISFSGLSPAKQEETVRIPLSGSRWVKVAIPVMKKRPTKVARVELTLSNGETHPLELLEDLSAVAQETFRGKAGLIYLKTVLRSVLKTTSSVILEEQSSKASSLEESLILGLLSLGTQAYAEASEQADLRLSRYFPAKAHVVGVTLPPGVYSYTVTYYDASNNPVHSVDFKDVEVRPGKLTLSEAICIK